MRRLVGLPFCVVGEGRLIADVWVDDCGCVHINAQAF
jgi:hypothetical protein